MAQVTAFSQEFLPQVIRLFSPDVKVDGKLPYYSEQYASYSGPETYNLLLKDEKQLLASAHAVSLGAAKFMLRLGIAPQLTAEQWQFFWENCCHAASQIAGGQPVTFNTVLMPESPAFAVLESSGFKITREITEMVVELANLSTAPVSELNFRLALLSDVPSLEQKWLDIFNTGLGSVIDVPAWEPTHFKRRAATAGFDRGRWFIGLFEGEPIVAGYYDVLDTSEGVAVLYLPLGPAHKIKGLPRQIVRDVLTVMHGRGLSRIKLHLDTQSQAAAMLYKLGGFQPQAKLVELVLEGAKVLLPEQEPEPEKKDPKSGDEKFFFPSIF